MTDETNAAPSNGAASEAVQPDVSTTIGTGGPGAAPSQGGEPKPPTSAREAVQRAFQSVAEPVKTAAERARDEAGRFAKANTPDTPKPDAKPVEVPKVEAKPEVAKPVVNAPTRFSKAAQEAWAQTPEPVRADVERAITELTQGIEGYKQQIEPIRKYADMAKQHGTTLDRALENYVGMEDLLQRDFVGGVRLLCQNLGVNPAQLVASLTGQQVNGIAPTQEVTQLREYIKSQEQKIAKLEEKFGGFESTFESTRAADMINRFAAENPGFDELRPDISEMLSTGYAKDLADAYKKALRLNPEVLAKVEAEKAAKAAPQQSQTTTPDPAQTRSKAALSVTGSPPVGSNPSSRKPAGSAREAVRSAFSQVSP